MTVTPVRCSKDVQRLTLTMEAEFDASPERVWQLWADPRQLEGRVSIGPLQPVERIASHRPPHPRQHALRAGWS